MKVKCNAYQTRKPGSNGIQENVWGCKLVSVEPANFEEDMDQKIYLMMILAVVTHGAHAAHAAWKRGTGPHRGPKTQPQTSLSRER